MTGLEHRRVWRAAIGGGHFGSPLELPRLFLFAVLVAGAVFDGSGKAMGGDNLLGEAQAGLFVDVVVHDSMRSGQSATRNI